MQNSQEQHITTFSFAEVERRVFDRNFLDTVVVELRYPTYLRLNESEPRAISESIRCRFPIYELKSEMQLTPLGTTNPQPVYQFTTRQGDPILEISASRLGLVTRKYQSFENMSSHVECLIEKVVPHLDTNFFTRVGLRYINRVSQIQESGIDVLDWINSDLVLPAAGGEIGTVSNMKSELTGKLKEGNYTFRYGLAPASSGERRSFLLDWDYYSEDIEVIKCIKLLNTFHDLHFPFFWWALGKKAKQVIENTTDND